jgi:hypothetical protein
VQSAVGFLERFELLVIRLFTLISVEGGLKVGHAAVIDSGVDVGKVVVDVGRKDASPHLLGQR